MCACMTHQCLRCHEIVCDNNPKGLCPKCGGDMIHEFDEDYSEHEGREAD